MLLCQVVFNLSFLISFFEIAATEASSPAATDLKAFISLISYCNDEWD